MGIKSKARYKGKEDCKPQSDLQQLNSLTNWVLYFCLREFPEHFISRLQLTDTTKQVIDDYNLAVCSLKANIRIDYNINKAKILKARKLAKK